MIKKIKFRHSIWKLGDEVYLKNRLDLFDVKSSLRQKGGQEDL